MRRSREVLPEAINTVSVASEQETFSERGQPRLRRDVKCLWRKGKAERTQH